MIFADTNLMFEPVRPRPEPRVVARRQANEGKLVISTVVLAELAYGIERIGPGERARRLENYLTGTRRQFAGRIHAFDEEATTVYGVIMGEASRRGRPLPVADGMIAATALRHGSPLATRNTAHFEGLRLDLINPWTTG